MTTSILGGQRAVIETARAMRSSGRAFALVLVARTEGSTYRKPGALALVGQDGTHVGVISGGCLESGVEMLASEAIEAGAARVTVFDTRSDDDLVFGSGSGCRGRMHVLAMPADAGACGDHVDAIIHAATERRVLSLPLERLAPGLFADGEVVIRPVPQLLIFGAGPEARPLLRIGRTLGWFSCIADHREGLVANGRVADADRVLCLRATAAVQAISGERFDAALVMTHIAEADLEALRALSHTDVPYVGLLGPPARRDELLECLEPGERSRLGGRLHAPVGLPLGGEGPEAIALAIAAQLQQAFGSAAP
jgi:xanthine dehydrogenase accessory factor